MAATHTACPLSSAAAPQITGAVFQPRFGVPTVKALLVGIVDLLVAWQERATQRHHLAGLDERGLKDVALSRADIAPEIAKPFWRA
ncbi:DUF1127 domain-containing protein [Oceanibaculum indicum]|uniref:Uncharacterized protein YjiS (DUF1127 family) n=1 Tax=Oceanibaculum indicum TaxID=526216 RepID=A0A420WRT9_9PROT|nr:DUF1127 domain-containing protein [Oceanibaculum indicum]RKQ73542.1 uncharacterized protein YjiS (DUF1127 family) [Oceanibaculum indicum]